MTKKQRIFRDILTIIMTCIFFASMGQPSNDYELLSYQKFINMLQKGDINKVEYNEESNYAIVYQTSDNSIYRVSVISKESFQDAIYNYSLKIDDFSFSTFKDVKEINVFIRLIISFAFFLVFKFTVGSIFMSINLKNIKKGKKVDFEENSDATVSSNPILKHFEGYKPKKAEKQEVKFSDVIGLEKQLAEFQDIVRIIKEPEKYIEMGAKLPKGILLHGKAGVGKTLIARAISGEAGVPFFAISASELHAKYLGESEERIRAVFQEAIAASPSIIFFDEIDSIATKRFSDYSSKYSASILNQLLACMDGFSKDTNVIVIAATNHIDELDDALLRSGRFDKKIYIHEPDRDARKKLIEYYSKDKLVDDMLDIDRIVDITAGLTGADIETILNEAAILSVRNGEEYITEDDIMEAFRKVEIGTENSHSPISKNKLEVTAVHEAGHAVLEHEFGMAISEISIISRGNAAGYNLAQKDEENDYSVEELKHRIMCLLGGRAAEEVVFKHVSAGAYDDLRRASSIIKDMFLRFSMREKKKISLVLTENDAFNRALINDTYAEMNDYMSKCYEETIGVIEDRRIYLDTLKTKLLEKETLSKQDIKSIFDKVEQTMH